MPLIPKIEPPYYEITDTPDEGGIKTYTAKIAQLTSGTDTPTATNIKSTLDGTVVWTRSSTGTYYGTLTGAFTTGKTICGAFGSNLTVMGLYNTIPFDYCYTIDTPDANTIRVTVIKTSDQSYADLYDAITSDPIVIQIQINP